MNYLTKRSSVFLAIALSAIGQSPKNISAQVDQRTLVERIRGQDAVARHEAVLTTLSMDPSDTGPELRSALVGALEAINEMQRRAIREGGVMEEAVDPHLHLDLVIAVSSLRDPSTTPALVGALGHGASVVSALASFGETSIPPVVEAVMSPESGHAQVDDGLAVLTRIAKGISRDPVSSESWGTLHRVAEARLTGKQQPATLKAAIDLAIALGDDRLRELVQRIASDPEEVSARGIDDPDLIAHIQRHAAKRLAERRREPE